MSVAQSDVVIAGTGMTAFAKHYDRSLRDLTEEAVASALDDAGIGPSDVGAVFFANAAGGLLTGQEMIAGQSSLRRTDLLGVPIVNVENACASASTAFALAVMAVRSGMTDIALAVGAEKMTHAEKSRSVTAIATAADLEVDPGARMLLSKALLGWDTDKDQRTTELPSLGSKFMDIYAQLTRDYMDKADATPWDLAAVAAKTHSNGALNPKAQYRRALTPEDVLASREVSAPLTLLMCSPIGDGAAAVVVCSRERAMSLQVPVVGIEAVALVSGTDEGHGETGAIVRALTKAYEQASLGPHDLDVIEVHDAAAPGELFAYEDIGLCARGEGVKFFASGATRLGGRVPVNPSGGLLSKGHPIGATGCAQLVELADQLRGRCGERQTSSPRFALAHNAGGSLGPDEAAAVVSILSAPHTTQN